MIFYYTATGNSLYVAKRLSENLHDTKIIFIGNCDITGTITDTMKETCEHYGLDYVALSGIDKINGHPTELGMKQICEQIISGIG